MTALDKTSVDRGDGRFASTVLRGGSGAAVVFMHGFGGVTATDPLAEALAERYEVIAPVCPGFTDLEEIEDIRDVHDLALHYDDLLDALGLDSVPVIGHSFGGMIAAELAAHVPHRVARLVLAAPVGLWNDAYPTADLFTAFPFEFQQLFWTDSASPVAQSVMAAQAAGGGEGEGGNPFVAMLLRALPGVTTATKYMWPLPDKGLSRRLYRIKAPTLVVWGADDKLIPPQYADDFVAGIRDARSEVLDGAAHMAPWERQDDFLKLVDEFLA
jgi:pimeloyl-ACP methyl ester carboxylesterase